MRLKLSGRLAAPQNRTLIIQAPYVILMMFSLVSAASVAAQGSKIGTIGTW